MQDIVLFQQQPLRQQLGEKGTNRTNVYILHLLDVGGKSEWDFSILHMHTHECC